MKRIAIATMTIPLLLVLGGCNGGTGLEIPGLVRKVSDEEKIEKLLDEVHRGMETKKVYQVMAHVSPNYLDEEGRDFEGIRKYLNQIMKNYRSIAIRRTPPTIVVEGDRARAVEAFGTLAEPDNDSAPPINIQGQVSVYLERDSDGWKIVEWGSIS